MVGVNLKCCVKLNAGLYNSRDPRLMAEASW